ncbi:MULTISPECIES: Flp family type IVb pilin [unclassified Vibrio]|uniref:Flp family type IVb pilin n=1 Tax=unclassified Vibrio TaxID=2614977 RepID=UPI0013616F03|nr:MULTISPECIES: Flp family type IVb pilin [unclassified Vibrio]NAW58288.1 Flp family type IVb pilin [Vibrio sp. V36_P2S2PM302]NAX20872.1 Flp family type IVb pilin [Vibrio sp. V39_P1S14PM300]NAX25944.1 Flp family type IVb pilin [Vibrio sp. V38_P2S17PM301]NAX32756.1 Flp family type IVb pilin [Vibrio sp. V37_P2S8PM304]
MNGINHYTTQLWCKLSAFIRDDKGASGIEYAIVAAIAAVAIAAATLGDSTITDKITEIFTSIRTALSPST